jgi:hypothetical protein
MVAGSFARGASAPDPSPGGTRNPAQSCVGPNGEPGHVLGVRRGAAMPTLESRRICPSPEPIIGRGEHPSTGRGGETWGDRTITRA